MINEFLNDHLPSFLYFQENPWRKSYIKNHVPKIKEKYEAVSHEHFDATVLYRKDVLKDEGFAELWELFQDAFNDKFDLDFVTFKERASFSKLTEIKTKQSFVAISWHGEHSGLTDQKKEQKFRNLLLVIKGINSKTKLPVVLGGDFNINLDSVSDYIEEQDLEVYEYDPQIRKTVIDFFVVTRDVELSDVRAFDDYMYIDAEKKVKVKYSNSESENEDQTTESEGEDTSDDSLDDLKVKVFDHDPVQAMLSFNLDSEDEDHTTESEGEQTSDDSLHDLPHDFDKKM